MTCSPLGTNITRVLTILAVQISIFGHEISITQIRVSPKKGIVLYHGKLGVKRAYVFRREKDSVTYYGKPGVKRAYVFGREKE